MSDDTDINWKIHWIELRAWIEQNPKAARAVGLLLALFAAFILGAILL